MPTLNNESSQVAEALDRLSAAMETLQIRYDAAERAHWQVRIALVVVLILLAGATYKVFSPLAAQLGALPQIISQALPGLRTKILSPDAAATERQRLMQALSPEKRARVEAFEKDQQWISDYIAATENFNPGATIALFLSNMSKSVEVMPDLYAELRSMTEEVRIMNREMRTMNDKMSSIPVLATEVQGMHTQMTALPVLSTDVKGMLFYMSIMAKDLDSTMGEAGRMMPWKW
jgi:hypothetical protein